MNGTPSPRTTWRDFLNRREPGAFWMLALLLLAAAVGALMLFGYHQDKPPGTVTVHYIPFALTLAAIVTFRWWSLPSAPVFPDPKWDLPPASRRWVSCMAVALTVLSMWPRTQRLNDSLSEAELRSWEVAWAFSRAHPASLGDDKGGPHGERRLVQEHVIAQHAGDGWRSSTVPPESRAMRTLPWIAGILTTGLIVLLGAALGSPRAGLAAGLIVAMHPGHVQWSAALADHAHTLFCFAAAVFSMLCALRTNRWRWWTALAASQAGLLLGHPSALLWAGALNVATAFTLLAPGLRDRASSLLRLVVALAVAGVVLSIPSIQVITGDHLPFPILNGHWVQAFTGVESDGIMETWRGLLLRGVLPLCALAGFYFMLRQDWRTRLFAGASVIALFGGPLAIVLPLLLVWSGAGLLRLFPSQPRLRFAPLCVAVLYVAVTMPVFQRTIKLPIQPLREAATTARQKAGATGITATLGGYASAVPSDSASVFRLETFDHHAVYAQQYDPRVQVVTSVSTLDALIDSAFEENLPLFVYRTGAIAAHPAWSAANAKLETSGQFQLVAEFPAFDPALSYELYRYQPREQIINLELKPGKKPSVP